jgi:hypothetical protein
MIPKDPTPTQERMEALILLHKYDKWDERLLSDVLFGNTVEAVLTPRERFVLEMKVEGKTDKYIRHVLNHNAPKGMGLKTYMDMKVDIKKNLREGFNQRLPGWVYGTDWEARRKGEETSDRPEELWKEDLP